MTRMKMRGWMMVLAFASLALVSAKSRTMFYKTGAATVSDTAMLGTETSLAQSLYNVAGLSNTSLSISTLSLALHGFFALQQQGVVSKPLLTIVDLSRPSFEKRLYIIDVEKQALLLNTYVAHGRNSGDVIATRFSNKPSSLQSSLGFYTTAGTYIGNNGYSLRLKGMEKGINDNALQRAIVLHGASYVNEMQAKHTGRIGRSWGCPAVPMQEHKYIIDLIKDGSCLFIYAPEKNYIAKSALASLQGVASETL